MWQRRQSGRLLIMSSMYFLFSILCFCAFVLQSASLIILYVFFFFFWLKEGYSFNLEICKFHSEYIISGRVWLTSSIFLGEEEWRWEQAPSSYTKSPTGLVSE